MKIKMNSEMPTIQLRNYSPVYMNMWEILELFREWLFSQGLWPPKSLDLTLQNLSLCGHSQILSVNFHLICYNHLNAEIKKV